MNLLIPNAQFIFGTLAEPRRYSPSSPLTYFAKFLIRETATIKKLEDAIQTIAAEKFKTVPKTLEDFTFDVDDAKYPEQSGGLIFNAKNEMKPKIFSRQREEIIPQEIYRGCYVNVSISIWAYDWQGKKGVGANLQGLQFNGDGQPLGAAVSVPDDFPLYDHDDDSQEALLGSPLG